MMKKTILALALLASSPSALVFAAESIRPIVFDGALTPEEAAPQVDASTSAGQRKQPWLPGITMPIKTLPQEWLEWVQPGKWAAWAQKAGEGIFSWTSKQGATLEKTITQTATSILDSIRTSAAEGAQEFLSSAESNQFIEQLNQLQAQAAHLLQQASELTGAVAQQLNPSSSLKGSAAASAIFTAAATGALSAQAALKAASAYVGAFSAKAFIEQALKLLKGQTVTKEQVKDIIQQAKQTLEKAQAATQSATKLVK